MNSKEPLRNTQYAIRNSLITWQTQTGTPIQVNGRTITLQSQVLQIRLPFGGFVWHGPVAVLVDGEIIPIVDVTRRALWAFIGLTILINVVAQIVSLRGKRRKT